MAGYAAPWYGPQHVPVIGPNGVPLETPEVQAAKAAHLDALSKAGSGASLYGPGPGPLAYAGPGAYNAAPYRYTPPAYPTSHALPAIAANGQPLDTPEVEAAKANHFAAYSQAHAALANAAGGHYGHY